MQGVEGAKLGRAGQKTWKFHHKWLSPILQMAFRLHICSQFYSYSRILKDHCRPMGAGPRLDRWGYSWSLYILGCSQPPALVLFLLLENCFPVWCEAPADLLEKLLIYVICGRPQLTLLRKCSFFLSDAGPKPIFLMFRYWTIRYRMRYWVFIFLLMYWIITYLIRHLIFRY